MADKVGIKEEDDDKNNIAVSGKPACQPKSSTQTDQPDFQRDLYEIKSKTGNVAIVFENFKFNGYKERKSGNADVLAKTFWKMGFEDCFVNCNLTCKELTSCLEELASGNELNSLVVCILTYGAEGFIYGTGGAEDRMEIEKIMAPFKGDVCKSLLYKPKIFFVQTWPPKPAEQTDGEFGDSEEGKGHMVPVEADFFFVQSCITGEDEHGISWFVNALQESIPSNNLLSAMTKVNRMLDEEMSKRSPKFKNEQVPYFSSTLRSELNFPDQMKVSSE